jgi:DNA-binding transcriptional LysR family regulator
MDKLKDIETFVSVVEKGSFLGASTVLSVTPVMIGRRISQLENRLGGELFHRTTRKLTLTRQGEVYLEHCRKILGRLEMVERLVTDSRHYATGHLIVSAPAAFGRRHIAPHLHEFMSVNPDVKVSLNLSDQVIDLVRSGYELGIRLGPVMDPNLVPVRLASSRPVVCGTPSYFEKNGIPLTPEDLAHHNCLAFNDHGGQQRGWQFQHDNRAVVVKVSGNLSCNDGELLSRWVREGLGIAWRPLWEVAEALASGELVSVLDDYAMRHYDILAVYPQQPHLPAKIGLFIAWMKSLYSRPGYWEPVPGTRARNPGI